MITNIKYYLNGHLSLWFAFTIQEINSILKQFLSSHFSQSIYQTYSLCEYLNMYCTDLLVDSE